MLKRINKLFWSILLDESEGSECTLDFILAEWFMYNTFKYDIPITIDNKPFRLINDDEELYSWKLCYENKKPIVKSVDDWKLFIEEHFQEFIYYSLGRYEESRIHIFYNEMGFISFICGKFKNGEVYSTLDKYLSNVDLLPLVKEFVSDIKANKKEVDLFELTVNQFEGTYSVQCHGGLSIDNPDYLDGNLLSKNKDVKFKDKKEIINRFIELEYNKLDLIYWSYDEVSFKSKVSKEIHGVDWASCSTKYAFITDLLYASFPRPHTSSVYADFKEVCGSFYTKLLNKSLTDMNDVKEFIQN